MSQSTAVTNTGFNLTGLSKHHDATLNQHYELARKFRETFGDRRHAIPVVESSDGIDAFGIRTGLIRPFSDPNITRDSSHPEWTHRLKERHEMLGKINLGAMSEHFPTEDRFQVERLRNGETYRIITLLESIERDGADLPTRTVESVKKKQKNIERKVAAIADVDSIEARWNMRSRIAADRDYVETQEFLAGRHSRHYEDTRFIAKTDSGTQLNLLNYSPDNPSQDAAEAPIGSPEPTAS